MNWLTGWTNRKQITVSATNVEPSLSGFPLYIPGTFGNDARFTESDGVTLLDHVLWGDAAYVKIPIDATSGASIYYYYGNASALDASTSDAVDAYAVFAPLRGHATSDVDLASGLLLALGGTAASGPTGVALDGGYLLVGESGDIQSRLAGESGLTCSGLFSSMVPGSSTDDYVMCNIDSADYYQAWVARTTVYSVQFSPNGGSGTQVAANAYPGPSNGDHHLAWTFACYDGVSDAAIKSYDNGALAASATSATLRDLSLSFGTPNRTDRLGYYTTAKSTNSTVSEFRILKGAASAAWLKFEKFNLMSTGNEITIGDEESASSSPSISYLRAGQSA